MLEELATNTPPFQFLHDSVLPQREPLQPELAAVRIAWAGLDSFRMVMKLQGAQLAAVTSQMHSADQEVQNLKRADAAHPEDRFPEFYKFCVDETVRQIVCLSEEKRPSAKRPAS
jgi:hypothetical protein